MHDVLRARRDSDRRTIHRLGDAHDRVATTPNAPVKILASGDPCRRGMAAAR
jgi:hypothetical protein